MRTAAAICVFATALSGVAADQRPFVESDPAELARSLPYLAGLKPAAAPERLDDLLNSLTAGVVAHVPMVLPEEIHEMSFEDDGMRAASRRESARYSIQRSAGNWREVRIGLPEGPPTGFFITGGFLDSLDFLQPARRSETRFLALGRMPENGRDALVVAFLRPAGVAQRQGLMWIDEAANRLLRVRHSLYGRLEGVPLETWSTDIRFVAPWVPSQVTVRASVPGRELLTVHRFDGAQGGEEPLEQMTRAIALTQEGKAAAAVTLLKELQRLDPQRIAVRFHLGTALMAAGDAAAAEAEWRAVVKALPGSAAAHNSLGIALYQRGDLAGAAVEFRECVRLQPDDATARENLAKAQAAGDPIRVDVRQVIVPVVVTAADGHFASGLTQADFQVLEDGMEQKISSFAVESTGLQTDLTQAEPKAQRSTGRAPAGPRSTYLICVDTLHSSLTTFTQVRQALIKLFRTERKGDSQYALIAAGMTLQVVQNMTTDPDEVLRALEDRAFQKLFQSSRSGSAGAELEQFERSLSETRVACDTHDPQCETRRAALPSIASSLAEAERTQMTMYLANLRSLVEQLGRAGSRRTMILISAGFQMTPGRDSSELLSAYFPELRGIQMRTMDRMTDAMEPVFRIAAKNNVTIHTIDSRGVHTSSYRESYRRSAGGSAAAAVERALNRNASEAGVTMDEIAAATGGTSFRNNNDVLVGLSRAIADGRDYYMLTYAPSNASEDGKFRAITVRVRDGKLAVRAKRGYWAGGSPTSGGN